MKLSNPPILRLYHLTIDAKDREAFAAEGVRNMTTSIANEPGTLLMAATYADPAGTSNYIIECYKDAASYQVHANSPQFKHYGAVASQVLTGKAMFELTPQLIVTKNAALNVSGPNSFYLRLISAQIPANRSQAFKEALTTEMKAGLKQEPGLLGCLAGTLADKPAAWRILEIYADQPAYQAHLQGTAFKMFADQTKDLIEQAAATELKTDTLVDQGKLLFEK
jgi:quinol monooxygenase YgiN